MIGLFLGNTEFPKLILEKIKEKKIKYFIIDLTKKKLFKKDKNCYHIQIGQFGKILDLLKSKKCKKAIFAGRIDRPNITKLKLDFKGFLYIPRIIKAAKKGDAAMLKQLIKILSENRVKIISSNFFNPELTLKKGVYSKIKPNKKDEKNIKTGIKILKKTNSLDHVQAVIVTNNSVFKENRNGTKILIKSIKKNQNQTGVLIKFPKKKQDLRVDLPTVGLNTLKDLKKKNLKGLVVKANKNIFLNKYDCIKFVDKNNMFLVSK